MKRIKRLILVLFHFSWVLVLCGTLWGAWYLQNKGFTKSWRNRVTSELTRISGVEVAIRRLTVDPFRGLVAQGVTIRDPKRPRETLATISEISLDVNYANLLQKRNFLNAIDLRDARLAIPVDPSDSKSDRVEATDLSARIFFPPHQIQISQAEFEFYGIEVFASGALIYPEGYRPEPQEKRSPEEIEKRKRLLRRLLAELAATRYPDGAPRIEIAFSGDLSEAENIRLEKVHLSAGRIEREEVQITRLEAALDYRGGVVRLARLQAADDEGEMLARGELHLPTGVGRLELRSTLGLRAFADEILGRKVLTEIAFYDPPQLDAELALRLQEQPNFHLIGQVRLGRFGLRSMVFDGFETGFSWDGQRMMLGDLRIRHRTGELRAKIFRGPEDVRIELDSSMDLAALVPLLEGRAAAALAEWEFLEPPEVHLVAAGTSFDPADLAATGTLALGPTRYRGVPLVAASASVRLADRAVTYEGLRVAREEGVATGEFTYDFGRGEARLTNMHSTLDPHAVALWIDARLARDIAPYRFVGVPELELDGTVKVGGGTDNRLLVKVNAPDGMLYKFIGKDLPFERVSGALVFEGDRLMLSGVQGDLYRGRVAVEADISLIREAPGHTASIEVADVDFASLTRLYFGYEDSEGRVRGSYRYRMTASPRDMEGQGTVKVIEGNVFAIPVLGPFSGILNEIVPGMGFTTAREAGADFTVSGGRIHTDNFEVLGQGFSMMGKGDLFFLDDRMDFAVRINAKGVPGIVLFPVSKLFEYVSDGKWSDPQWHPKHLPRITR